MKYEYHGLANLTFIPQPISQLESSNVALDVLGQFQTFRRSVSCPFISDVLSKVQLLSSIQLILRTSRTRTIFPILDHQGFRDV